MTSYNIFSKATESNLLTHNAEKRSLGDGRTRNTNEGVPLAKTETNANGNNRGRPRRKLSNQHIPFPLSFFDSDWSLGSPRPKDTRNEIYIFGK